MKWYLDMNKKKEIIDYPKITILIPVYNGEKYLSKTIESVLKQEFKEYEVIFINDYSNDRTREIIEKYENTDSRIRLINTEKNMGNAPKALNVAIPFIRGDYYVYSSQDDLFSEDWLKCMYERAIETGADAVIPRFIYYHENNSEKCLESKKYKGSRDDIIDGKEAFVLSLNWTIPLHVLWKTELIKDEGYSEFSINADEYTVRKNYLKCKKVAFSCGKFYYRQDNSEAITKKFSIKKFDQPLTEYMLWKLANVNNISKEKQNILITSSILSMIDYKCISYKKKYNEGRKIINECYKYIDKKNVYQYIKKNMNNDYRKIICITFCMGKHIFDLLGYMRYFQKITLSIINTRK